MKRTVLALIPLLAALTLLAGCSSTSLSGTSGLESEIRELQARVIELQRKAAVSEVEMTRLRTQLAELEARTGGSGSPAREVTTSTPPVARESGRPIEVAPVATPIAVVEETDLDDDTPADSSVDLFEESAPSSPPPPSSPPAGGAVVTDLSSEGQALYDEGYTLYHQQEFLDAEAAFRRFLEGYPGTDLADNAQYWIGECRFSRADLRGALAAFRETVNRYPEGNKVPDALLKSGQVLEELGDTTGARQSYREVQRRFPDSAAAVVATERLQHL